MPPALRLSENTFLNVRVGALLACLIGLISSVWYMRGVVADNHEFQVITTRTLSALVSRVEKTEQREEFLAKTTEERRQDWSIWRARTDDAIKTGLDGLSTVKADLIGEKERRQINADRIKAVSTTLEQHVGDGSIHIPLEKKLEIFVSRADFRTEVQKIDQLYQRLLALEMRPTPAPHN